MYNYNYTVHFIEFSICISDEDEVSNCDYGKLESTAFFKNTQKSPDISLLGVDDLFDNCENNMKTAPSSSKDASDSTTKTKALSKI